MSEPCNDVGPTGTLCIHAKGHEGFHRDANFVWSPGSPKPSDSESSVPAPRPSETPPMTVDYSTEPLTYEQEIHSLLYTARTWGRDLKAIFERDLASGKLTPREREVQLLCLANFRTDLARIDAAIPLAEARRSPSVPTATVNNETNVARAEADRNVREIVRHFNLTGCKIEGATLRAFILGVLEAVSPVPSSEEAANSDTKRQTLSKIEAAWRRVPSLRLGQLIINALPAEHDGDPYYLEDSELADSVFDFAARVQGENSQ